MTNQSKNNSVLNSNGDVLSFKQISLLSLMSVLFALMLPLSAIISPATDFLSWIVCIVFGVWIMVTSRKFSSVILLGFAVTFFASYTGSAASVALVLGIVSACGMYSALISSAKGKQIILPILIPAITLAGTYVITASFELALFSLALFLPSLVMGIITRCGGGRVTSIAGFAITAMLELCASLIVAMYIFYGAASFEIINEAAGHFTALTEQLLTFAIESASEAALTEDISLFITEIAVEPTNMLFGLTCMIAVAVGFFAQKLQHTVFERFELEALQNQSGAPITASVAAALVYIAAYICSFTTGASSAPSFVAVVAGNISFILLPLLLCVGFGFMASLPRRLGFLAVLAWIGAAAASYLLSSSIIDIIALVGAFYTLIVSIDLWAGEHYSKGGDQ